MASKVHPSEQVAADMDLDGPEKPGKEPVS